MWRCSCYKTLSIYENQIVTPDYYLFVSTIGYIFVGGLAQFVICSFDVKKCKLFLLIGKSTLYILLFHISIWTRILNPLVSKITNLPITSNECFSSTVGWGILYILIGLLIPTLLNICIIAPAKGHFFNRKN